MEELQKQIDELKQRILFLEQKDNYDEDLFEELRKERNSIADENNWNYYCVLDNEVLKEIALKKPTTKDELVKIKGIKEMKYQQFGENILLVVNQYLKTNF